MMKWPWVSNMSRDIQVFTFLYMLDNAQNHHWMAMVFGPSGGTSFGSRCNAVWTPEHVLVHPVKSSPVVSN